MDDPILDTESAGAHIKTPPATMQWWRHRGCGPKYLKIGRRVYYRKSNLDEFLAAAEVSPEAA